MNMKGGERQIIDFIGFWNSAFCKCRRR